MQQIDRSAPARKILTNANNDESGLKKWAALNNSELIITAVNALKRVSRVFNTYPLKINSSYNTSTPIPTPSSTI